MAVPGPVVVELCNTVVHDRALRVCGFARTQELTIPIDVDLKSDWVCIPSIVGAVGH